MTTIITTIILTILALNAIAVIIYLVSNKNEDAVCYFAMGVICGITNLIGYVYSVIQKAYIKKNFKALLVDTNGNKYYCESADADYFIYDDEEIGEVKFDRATVDKYKITDGWMKCHCNKIADVWVLSARYAPLKICLKENAKYLKKPLDK
jgi:hypothetical protein